MRKRSIVILTLLAALVIALVSSCSERSIDARSGKGMQIAIRFSNAPVAIQDWEYRLIVTAEDMPTITVPLILSGGFLEGTVEVPAGPARTFTIEVFEAGTTGEQIIYSGSRTIDVIADEQNVQLLETPIILSPVTAMVRTSPVYVQRSAGGTFVLNINMDNIMQASQISFQVRYDPRNVTPTSADLHPEFPIPNDYTLFTAQLNDYWAFSIFDTTIANVAISGSTGDAKLVTMNFQIPTGALEQPTQISVDSVFILDVNGDTVQLQPFYLDETTVDIVPPANTVEFGEPALEEVVRDSLDIIGKQPIPLESAGSLTALRARDRFLQDLSGLQSLTGLLHLSIGNNLISDITPVGALTNLRTLAIDHNRITTITPLSNLTSLNRLDALENKIIDLTALQSLTQLTVLQLPFNSIVDVSPLSGLTDLDTLGLEYNNISDISGFEALINLSWLNLERNNISDISPLINNSGLQAGDLVNLRRNPVAIDVQQISQLTDRGVIVITE